MQSQKIAAVTVTYNRLNKLMVTLERTLAEELDYIVIVHNNSTDGTAVWLTPAAAEVRRLYAFRAQVEEVIRACKDQLGLSGGQARSERAQLHHLTCCLVAFACWSVKEMIVVSVSINSNDASITTVDRWHSPLWSG